MQGLFKKYTKIQQFKTAMASKAVNLCDGITAVHVDYNPHL